VQRHESALALLEWEVYDWLGVFAQGFTLHIFHDAYDFAVIKLSASDQDVLTDRVLMRPKMRRSPLVYKCDLVGPAILFGKGPVPTTKDVPSVLKYSGPIQLVAIPGGSLGRGR
jgi:hypothetical protein